VFLTTPSLLVVFSCSACQAVCRVLELLAEHCPPRDLLTLLLEVSQLGDEDDSRPLPLRLALLRACGTVLRRMPRQTFRSALGALPVALSAVRAAGDADESGEDAKQLLDAALDVGDVLLDASCKAPDADEARWLTQRSALQLLHAVTFDGHAAGLGSQVRALQLCQGAKLTTWAALRDALAPLDRADEVDSDSEQRNSDASEPVAPHDSLVHGAGLLAEQWLTAPGGGDALGDDAASQLALRLLGGTTQAAACGTRLVRAACLRAKAAGTPGREDEAAFSELALALATAMAQSPSPVVRTQAYDALLLLLDAHAPWTRLAQLRALVGRVRDPGVVALLFKRVKDDAALTWGHPPFGGAPAARMLTDWLALLAGAGDEGLADAADAAVGALNGVRFMLLRDTAAGTEVSGLRSSGELAQLRDVIVQPLARAADRLAQASVASGSDDDTTAMLMAQTLVEVTARVLEAIQAAAGYEIDPSVGPGHASAAISDEQRRPPAGIRRGFLG
jgi:hypothetical protein